MCKFCDNIKKLIAEWYSETELHQMIVITFYIVSKINEDVHSHEVLQPYSNDLHNHEYHKSKKIVYMTYHQESKYLYISALSLNIQKQYVYYVDVHNDLQFALFLL